MKMAPKMQPQYIIGYQITTIKITKNIVILHGATQPQDPVRKKDPQVTIAALGGPEPPLPVRWGPPQQRK
jgi:hypothetical protein